MINTVDDYGKYFNNGNDCDACLNQYLCGVDGDAVGCRCCNEGKECDFVEYAETIQFTFPQSEALFDEQKCRICGCTWEHACEGGCYWVEDDLCSKCIGMAEGSVSR